MAYAEETFQIYSAKADIAERKYQQLLLATQLSKMEVLKLRRMRDQCAQDVTFFQSRAPDTVVIDDPDWFAPSINLRRPSVPPQDPGNAVCHDF